ncbi:MAG: hypothetical protein FWC16_02940 [Defluviitaleaceae bacterium]|nr:hypothetical protein [Defluviitaleaceae bacterium]MCL2273857.1 hypothetical protein [Defluviitaleaceae bacterium]
MENKKLIREKDGIRVYRDTHENAPAVTKYFDKTSDRREICNYLMLQRLGIPTIKVLHHGEDFITLEDINASPTWRLGTADDLADAAVAKSLAHWYFTLHENGTNAAQRNGLYFEYNQLTRDNLNILRQKFPEGAELLDYVLAKYDAFAEMVAHPTCTLTYNDFYWTNLTVRKDKQAAMMFDYNLLGKGWRASDIRNVTSALSKEANIAFTQEYSCLFTKKHGHDRSKIEQEETRINELAAPLFALYTAFVERDPFPTWAEDDRQNAVNGTLLAVARGLL